MNKERVSWNKNSPEMQDFRASISIDLTVHQLLLLFDHLFGQSLFDYLFDLLLAALLYLLLAALLYLSLAALLYLSLAALLYLSLAALLIVGFLSLLFAVVIFGYQTAIVRIAAAR